jgi:pimeloyl-ACP methyl ester carboxylesterase
MLKRSLQPLATYRTVRVATGRAVGVYEYGDPGGFPVFALHGTPSCGAGFSWADAPARERGLRILAPDRPGIGFSDRAPLARVADYAPELDHVADALEIGSYAVLGYSGGGPYAVAAAHGSARARLASVVSGSGQLGAWADMRDYARSDRQLMQVALRSGRLAHASLAFAARITTVAPRLALASVRRELSASDRDVMQRLGATPRDALEAFTHAFLLGAGGVLDDYLTLSRPWGLAPEEIDTPMQLWHGTADTMVPLHHSEMLASRVPDATLQTWPGEGHLAIIPHVGEVLDGIVGRLN